MGPGTVYFQLEHFLRRLDRFLSVNGFHEEREKAVLRNIKVLVSNCFIQIQLIS